MKMRRLSLSILVAGLIGIVGCGPSSGEGERAAEPERGSDWVVTALDTPAEDADGVLRVLVYHDMEGLAGQDDPRTYLARYAEHYAEGRALLTGDVNAVIAGLFEGGADEVHVVDAHGSGSREPDLLTDELDSRAERIVRDTPFRQYVDLVEPGIYDAIAVVGMHAKTGSGGFASHTFTLGMDWILNGQTITETEIIAYAWGPVGVPVIFASGDDRLEADLSTMPWIEYVRVKDASSAGTAALRPLGEARAALTSGARRAVERLDEARVMKLGVPVQAALRVVHPARLDMLAGVPGIDYENQTVAFEAEDFAAAYDGIVALIGVATAGYNDLWREVVATSPQGQDVDFDRFELLFRRWMEVESGTYEAPSRSEDPDRVYHGAN